MKNKVSDLSTGALIVWGILLVLAIAALGAVLTMLLWNIAVVAIVATCGGTIGKIGFWLALGVNLIIGSLSASFKTRTASSS